VVPHRLRKIVLQQCEDAAGNRDSEQQHRRRPQRLRSCRAIGTEPLRLIDRLPEEARNEQLQRRRDERRDDRDGHLPWMAEIEARNPPERADTLTPRRLGDVGKCIGALRCARRFGGHEDVR
jgi:hypothetical protein